MPAWTRPETRTKTYRSLLARSTPEEQGISSSALLAFAEAADQEIYETPFCISVGMKFSGNELIYNSESNVAFGPTKKPQLVGDTD